MGKDSGGYAVGDFIGGVLQNHRNARAAREVFDAVDSWRERAETMEGIAVQNKQTLEKNGELAAGYLATLRALRRALADADPDHPMLQEGAISAVELAGATAFRNGTPGNRLYEARDCGDAIQLPARGADVPPAPRQALAVATAGLKQSDEQLAKAVDLLRELKQTNELLAADNERLGAVRGQMLNVVTELTDKFNLDLQEHRAERIGYREALRRLSPDHPLLSAELRGRLRRSANLAFTFEAQNSDRDAKWRALDAAVVAFVDEQVPEAPPTPREKQLTSDAHEVIEMVDNDLIDHRGQRAVFRSELARLHPTHPLVTDADLRSAVAKIGGMAYTLSAIGDRWKALDEAAYEHFVEFARSSIALQLINDRMGVPGPFTSMPLQGPSAEYGDSCEDDPQFRNDQDSDCSSVQSDDTLWDAVVDAQRVAIEQQACPDEELAMQDVYQRLDHSGVDVADHSDIAS